MCVIDRAKVSGIGRIRPTAINEPFRPTAGIRECPESGGSIRQLAFWVQIAETPSSLSRLSHKILRCVSNGREPSSRKCSRCVMLNCDHTGDRARRLINLLVIVRPLQRGNHVNFVVNQQLDSECQVRRHGFYPAPISRSDL